MIDDCHTQILCALEEAHGRPVELTGGVMRFSINLPPIAQPPLDARGEALDRSDCWVEVSTSEIGIQVLGQNYSLAAWMIVRPDGEWEFYPPQGCDYSGPTYGKLGDLNPETVRGMLGIFS